MDKVVCVSKGSLGSWIKCSLNSFCVNLQKTFPVMAAPWRGPRLGQVCVLDTAELCRQENLWSSANEDAGRSGGP